MKAAQTKQQIRSQVHMKMAIYKYENLDDVQVGFSSLVMFAIVLQGRLNCDIDLNITISVLSKDFFGCSGLHFLKYFVLNLSFILY